MAYRFYVTDSLRYVLEGKRITKSFYDMLYEEKKEEKSAEEIIKEVMEKAGLKMR